jgi:mRNA interferase MazF
MREVNALQEKKASIRRGDIFYADLSPVLGCEQGGVRPVLVIQNDIGNKYSPTLIVAAITSKPKRELPTHVEVLSIEALQKNSVVLLEQIRTIDRIRLLDYIGSLSRIRMSLVDRALAVSVGLIIADILHDQ